VIGRAPLESDLGGHLALAVVGERGGGRGMPSGVSGRFGGVDKADMMSGG